MSHMNESCHIWMSHVTYEWVMSHMNESSIAVCIFKCHAFHIYNCRALLKIKYQWWLFKFPFSGERLCHTWMRHVTHWWGTLHMNGACHIWMSHVTYESVIAHHYIVLSHLTLRWVMSHMNEACHIWMRHVTYEWVMSHIWMSHVTLMNEACHIWMSHVTS